MKLGFRNAALVALLAVGALLSAPSMAALIFVDFASLPAGQSVVGAGVVHPLLTIGTSGGNDVVALHEEQAPVAYGGGTQQVTNGCLVPGGFADIGGPPSFSHATKKHEYDFTFAKPIQRFALRMLDWSDFMPYGANADHVYAMRMTAYNAAGLVVDTDEISFSSDDTEIHRESPQFGQHFAGSGDACLATPGQPGNFTFNLEGPGIVRVQFRPKDRPSMDPHIAFTDLAFELADSDGDGVPDGDDRCPNSDLRQFVDTGGGPTTVVNTVDEHGCSIQDLVNAAAARARNHGQYMAAIADLANGLRKAGKINQKQSAELKTGAARSR